MNILHLDINHPTLAVELSKMGCINEIDASSSKEQIEKLLFRYDGVVIRSRFTIDQTFIDAGKKLKFIARVGAGLENIDVEYAKKKGIELINAPEGNRNAVAEHTLGMLLSLLNNFKRADKEVGSKLWKRESNRGVELDGKCVGIIGYGNMGKAFSKKLRGFDVEVIFHDIKPGLEDENAKQVSLEQLQKRADVLSLHVPLTALTQQMVNEEFIHRFSKPIYLINTARGKCVNTQALVSALREKKILGVGLDVLEFEKPSFKYLSMETSEAEAFKELLTYDNVLLTPHIAGWTMESKEKLALTLVDKIRAIYF